MSTEPGLTSMTPMGPFIDLGAAAEIGDFFTASQDNSQSLTTVI
ncbi:MAG: hypothetical protein BECKG1743D_GA0114223_108402 [Candidatus Kentron sp. G]|nr:MAG: hypothetical protein BECKG1743F_GA0114225_106902 [Candidatus Kentron sp. G]VFN06285.1 MAG: hypothetical protein BECKG1743D_GA0114223_108402 [Candidatus Kentron sp. G]